MSGLRPYPLTLCFIVSAALDAAPPAAVEQRISALIARMTLDEKIGQMSQSTSMKTPISAEIKDEIRKGRWLVSEHEEPGGPRRSAENRGQ
jgi:hypothetical protein